MNSEKRASGTREIKTSLISVGKRVSLLVSQHGWLNILLLFIALEIAVLSIELVEWISPQPSLTAMLALSILTVWLLTRRRIPGIAVHVIALAAGVLVTLSQAYLLLPAEGFSEKWELVTPAIQAFGQVDGVNVSFAGLISMLIWMVGYISAWFMLRRHNAWVAVFLGTVVIIVNLSNLPGGYYYFFLIYMLAAVVLLTHNRVAGQSSVSSKSGRLPSTALLLSAVTLAGIIAWVTPTARIPPLETAIASQMLWTRDIEDSRLNPFSLVESKQSRSTTNTRRGLAFGEKWAEGEDIRYIVNSGSPSYWRVKIYDTYTSRGWVNSPTRLYLQQQDEPLVGTTGNNTITYTVTTNVNSNVMLTAGGFIQSDTPAVLHIGAGGYVVAASVPRLLLSGESYTVTSGISLTASDMLIGVGTDYPDSVTADYLQLPSGFPENISELTEEITEGKESPYEKVLAISNYLSRFPYDEEVEAPPVGTDAVEHFLYTQQSGFCLYFASAMAVMLRSADVPSRLVVGYLPGDPGEVAGEYVLKNKHYHAWPQAYFPGYGWVDLEVTPRTDIAPAVATPWVTDRISGEWLQWYSLQELAAFMGASPPVDVTVEVGALTPPGVSSRWPFAEALGQVLMALLIIVLVAGVIALFIHLRRSGFYGGLWRVDRANCAVAVYNRMCALGSMVGIEPGQQMTPHEYAEELAAAFPQQEAAVYDITRAYVENRFARKDGKLDLFEEAEILKARCSVFESLLKRLSFSDKLFYRWKQ